MKKLIGVFCCMLMIGSTLLSTQAAPIETPNFETGDGSITISIPVGDYEIRKEGQNDEIIVSDYGRLLIPGKPNLPAKIFSIAIPPGAIVQDVQYQADAIQVLPGRYQIAPCPLPRVIGEEDPVIYQEEQHRYSQNYQSVYGQDTFYPLSISEMIETGGYRKYNLVDVRITPCAYNPLSGKITVYQDITVTIFYTVPLEYSSDEIMSDTLPKTEQTAKQIILNYDQAQQWYTTHPTGREQYDYVIITLDSLTSSVSSLVDWETTKGRRVQVVTTSWINSNYEGYDLAAKMRAFLREKYPSSAWGIQDVCLIGHYDDVPMRRTAQNQGYGQPETDYYYAELSLSDSQSWDSDGDHLYGENSDPIDFQAEINVGRIPWSEPTTVQHICEKSVAYEQNTDDSYKKNILLLAAFFWSDTDNAVLMEYKTNPTYYPWMADWTKTRIYEDAQSSYPCDYDLSYNTVKSVWSAGTYGFVDWAGHGSPDACYECYPSQPFVDTNTCLQLNDDYPAVIFADACSNSDTDDLNIGQSMLKRGGVGFLGATKVAYGMHAWNDPSDGSSQSLDCFFTTKMTSGEYTLGEAHQWALREMYVNNLWYYDRYETFEWGAIWGNPDLTMGPVIISDPPAQPSKPAGKTLGVWNEQYTYTSTTTDPDGEDIFYLFNWGDGSNSGWVGPYASGQTGNASHSWTELGTYSVTVKARDIWGASSVLSEPLTVVITDNTPPNTPTITGPTTVKPNVEQTYTLTGTDDQDQDLTYYIDWGDGNAVTGLGPYHSGETFTLTHTYTKRGTVVIKTRTTDTVGAQSEWGTIEVAVPFEYRVTLQAFIQHLLERFPNAFPLLRYRLGW